VGRSGGAGGRSDLAGSVGARNGSDGGAAGFEAPGCDTGGRRPTGG
jgi:hypothetical protein